MTLSYNLSVVRLKKIFQRLFPAAVKSYIKMVSKRLLLLLLAALVMIQYSVASGSVLEELGKFDFNINITKYR